MYDKLRGKVCKNTSGTRRLIKTARFWMAVRRIAVAGPLRGLVLTDWAANGRTVPAQQESEQERGVPLFGGTIPLKTHVYRADDILTAIRIVREFGAGSTIDPCTEGRLVIATHAGKPPLWRFNREYAALPLDSSAPMAAQHEASAASTVLSRNPAMPGRCQGTWQTSSKSLLPTPFWQRFLDLFNISAFKPGE